MPAKYQFKKKAHKFLHKYPRLLLIPMLLATGCARPNYQEATTAVAQQSKCAIRFTKLGLCAGFEFLKPPSLTASAEGILFLSHDAPADLTLTTELKMVMQSYMHFSAPARIQKMDGSHFHLTKIYLYMAGDWQIHLRWMRGTETMDEAVMPVSF